MHCSRRAVLKKDKSTEFYADEIEFEFGNTRKIVFYLYLV
jgi:hypothetical protein